MKRRKYAKFDDEFIQSNHYLSATNKGVDGGERKCSLFHRSM